MALFQCSFFSSALGTAVRADVLMPYGLNGAQGDKTFPEIYAVPQNGFRVIYLLHGMLDDGSCWVRNTNIERYAGERGIAVVMPGAGNGFYTDMRHGQRYYTYIAEELPALVQASFPVSKKREDTFVAGLSMGGYGALKVGLRNPKRYTAAASMSGAVDIVRLIEEAEARGGRTFPVSFGDIFGDTDAVAGSENDLYALLRQRKAEGNLPRLYQAVGTEDMLYGINAKFRDTVRDMGIGLTYEEGPGGHEWAFWDTYIQRILDWVQNP